MEPRVEEEAKFFIAGGIEKATTSAGIDVKVSDSETTKDDMVLVRLQIGEGPARQTVRTQLPLHHGRGLQLRSDPPSQL